MSDVTRILTAVEKVDPRAAEQLLPLVYDELRKLSAQKMAGEASGHTLQATASGLGERLGPGRRPHLEPSRCATGHLAGVMRFAEPE
ncbi:MAG TPA: ECF-type sigma factor [Gemmataceae bacterium]|nr:ECF-type sigma factor [Gemmataceae bacterium]